MNTLESTKRYISIAFPEIINEKIVKKMMKYRSSKLMFIQNISITKLINNNILQEVSVNEF